MSVHGGTGSDRSTVKPTRMDPSRKSHPKNVGAGTVGGFQGNTVGQIGLNCKFQQAVRIYSAWRSIVTMGCGLHSRANLSASVICALVISAISLSRCSNAVYFDVSTSLMSAGPGGFVSPNAAAKVNHMSAWT
jgi:hypothetical protein